MFAGVLVTSSQLRITLPQLSLKPVFQFSHGKAKLLKSTGTVLTRALTWPDGSGPDQIVDDGGDATMLIHQSVRAEAGNRQRLSLMVLQEVKKKVFSSALSKRVLKEKPNHWTEVLLRKLLVFLKKRLLVFTDLIQMQERWRASFPGNQC